MINAMSPFKAPRKIGLLKHRRFVVGGSAFSPVSMFTSGEQGWVYDLADFSTLFQDSAGTTPVTAVGQPVGRVLDKSKGLVLGPELVTNGAATVGTTGWATTGNATLSVVDGEFASTKTAASNGSFQLMTGLTVGRTYKVSVTMRGTASNAATAFVSASTSTSPLYLYLNSPSLTNVTLSGVFVAAETSHRIYMNGGGAAYPNTTYYDNITVRELPGNHAYQTTAGKRPLLNNINSTLGLAGADMLRVKYDYVDDELITQVPTGNYWIAHYNSGGFQCYPHRQVSGAFIPRVEAVGMLMIDREPTQVEKDSLRDYWAAKALGLPTGKSLIVECLGSSYVGQGGDSGAGNSVLWEFGDGAQYATMFTATEPVTPRELLTFEQSDPSKLSVFWLDSNKLTGSIPDLSANTGLSSFSIYDNKLTGRIPDLSANIALTEAWFNYNELTGRIPDLSANTALSILFFDGNKLTGSIPDLSANIALTSIGFSANRLTGSIPDLSNNASLAEAWFISNQLTDVAAGFSVPQTLAIFEAQNNQLAQPAIDAILAAFVAAGRTGANTLNLGGAGNAAPSAAGLTDKSTLQSRGWTVITN